MEGLKLEDLKFEDTSGEVFDAFSATNAMLADSAPKEPDSEKKEKIEKPPQEGEDESPESVAKGDKDIQGQADKATEKKDEEEVVDSSSPKPNDSEQLYSTLATHFIEKGVLSDLDPNNIKNLEDLDKALSEESNKRFDSTQTRIMEALKVGAPVNEVAQKVEVLDKLKTIDDNILSDPNNSSLRVNIIAQDFQNRGYPKERALKLAQRSVDTGEDVEDAKLALNGLISYEEKAVTNLIQNAKDQEQDSLSKLKDYLSTNSDKIAPVKLSTVQQEEIFRQMTTDTGNRENAFIKAQREDPIGMRVKMETLYYLTKGFTDYSMFSTAAESKSAKEIENLLRGASFTADGKINTEVGDPNANFTLNDIKKEGLTFGD